MSDHREKILAIFGHNPMSTRSLAIKCIDEGVLSDEWLGSAGVRAAQYEVRAALKSSDEVGLPRAGVSGEEDETGAPIW